MDKLDLIIREKLSELHGLRTELQEALTGIESPDFMTAARISPLIAALEVEIGRLQELRRVPPAPESFQAHFSRLLTDDKLSSLEIWTGFKDYWNDCTVRVLVIRKLKTRRDISCTIRFTEPFIDHLHLHWTLAELRHLGWKTLESDRTVYYKTGMRSPAQFDAFCQMMSVAMLEPLANLWKRGTQYYRFQ